MTFVSRDLLVKNYLLMSHLLHPLFEVCCNFEVVVLLKLKVEFFSAVL